MRFFDFSSWEGILFTFLGIAMFTLISMGIRLIMMFTIQQKQQRTNRQINERLKTLIAAYKTLGGSFTGNLSVDPTHLRDLRRKAEIEGEEQVSDEELVARDTSFDRPRRIRDAVEAALSDIILLGTEEQVKLAAEASRDLVAGKPVYTDKLVISLRDFIRDALDLAPIPASIEVPSQGPTRPSSAGGRGGRGGAGGGEGGRGGGGGGGGGMAGGGGGMGMGMGMGFGSRNTDGST